MKSNNYSISDFPESVQKGIRELSPTVPKLIMDDNHDTVGVIMSPEQYASMCDQVVLCRVLALGVSRLTGAKDVENMSVLDFLKVCNIDDAFLAAECGQSEVSQ